MIGPYVSKDSFGTASSTSELCRRISSISGLYFKSPVSRANWITSSGFIRGKSSTLGPDCRNFTNFFAGFRVESV